MMHNNFVRSVAALGLLLVLVALPLTAVAAQSHKTKGSCNTSTHGKAHTLATSGSEPVIQVGQYGGNIRPWSATVNADGTVAAKGITPTSTHLADPNATLKALLKLADAETFWSMTATTACPGTNPDVASRYVQITSNTGTKKVAVHGGCIDRFNQLFAMAMATANLHF